MYLIELKRNGERVYTPGYDLAFQVYVRDYLDLEDDVLFPIMRDASVQIGRYQNAAAEVNHDYLKRNKIDLIRRDTGGGAIYTDRGNIGFCFLLQEDELDTESNFTAIYQPVIEVLHELGAVNVEMSGRNDLEIEGKKISGMAMTVVDGITYGGFNLIYQENSEALSRVLTPSKKKLQAKGIKSTKSRVTSLRRHLAPKYQSFSSEEFMNLLSCKLLGVESLVEAKIYKLTEKDWKVIDQMVEEKYRNWDWNYGASPRFDYTEEKRIEGLGTIEVTLSVAKGKIKEIKFYGDFFGNKSLENLEARLTGLNYKEETLAKELKALDIKQYFGAPIEADIIDLLFGQM